MERVKISVANANLALKVNTAFDGDFTRNQRGTAHGQAAAGPARDARAADVGAGHAAGAHPGQTDLLLQALLVHPEGLPDDGGLPDGRVRQRLQRDIGGDDHGLRDLLLLLRHPLLLQHQVLPRLHVHATGQERGDLRPQTEAGADQFDQRPPRLLLLPLPRGNGALRRLFPHAHVLPAAPGVS